jgi:hypothetical protein
MVALPLSLAKTKPKCNKNAIATREKKETTAVVFSVYSVFSRSWFFGFYIIDSPNSTLFHGFFFTMPCWVNILKWIVAHINKQPPTIQHLRAG